MQLTLPVSLRDEATFKNFYSDGNAQLCHCLQQLHDAPGERFIYWWGVPGSGRSHLLQACCHAAGEAALQAVYLDMADEQRLSPAVFTDLEQLSLIALDNVNAIIGKRDWEEALFHLYNRVRDKGDVILLMASCAPARQLTCVLPDLQSRLTQGLSFKLHELSDDEKIQALQLRATNRGLPLTKEVAQYVLRHQPRDMSALFSTLEKLDQASLSAKRKLTIPFVKRVLMEA